MYTIRFLIPYYLGVDTHIRAILGSGEARKGLKKIGTQLALCGTHLALCGTHLALIGTHLALIGIHWHSLGTHLALTWHSSNTNRTSLDTSYGGWEPSKLNHQ